MKYLILLFLIGCANYTDPPPDYITVGLHIPLPHSNQCRTATVECEQEAGCKIYYQCLTGYKINCEQMDLVSETAINKYWTAYQDCNGNLEWSR